jgi:hypothetical protein
MSLALALIGVVLLLLPGLSQRVPRHLRPAECSLLIAVALSSGLLLLEFGLALVALPTFFGSRYDFLGMHTPYALAHLPAGSPILGWPAAALAVVIALLTFRAALQMRTLRKLTDVAGFGERRNIVGHEVVVLPTPSIVAFASSGGDGRVVLSSGLIDSLPAEHVEAVVRHEAAHVNHSHQRLLALAELVERGAGHLLPPIRRSTDALRLYVERWADEAAAGQYCRQQVCAAVSSFVARLHDNGEQPAAVEERIRALTTDPTTPTSRRRVMTYSPVVGLSAFGFVFVGDGIRHAGILATFWL